MWKPKLKMQCHLQLLKKKLRCQHNKICTKLVCWKLRNADKRNQRSSPGWCGSVDRELDSKPKGHWLPSQSGHIPGLRVRSPFGGVQEATDQCLSLSLSLSLPLSLNIINKIFKKKIKDLNRSSILNS